MIALNSRQIEILFLCSFRYALSRSTGVSYDISEMLITYKDELPQWAKEQIIRDIEREIERMNESDIENWKRVIMAFNDEGKEDD